MGDDQGLDLLQLLVVLGAVGVIFAAIAGRIRRSWTPIALAAMFGVMGTVRLAEGGGALLAALLLLVAGANLWVGVKQRRAGG